MARKRNCKLTINELIAKLEEWKDYMAKKGEADPGNTYNVIPQFIYKNPADISEGYDLHFIWPCTNEKHPYGPGVDMETEKGWKDLNIDL